MLKIVDIDLFPLAIIFYSFNITFFLFSMGKKLVQTFFPTPYCANIQLLVVNWRELHYILWIWIHMIKRHFIC